MKSFKYWLNESKEYKKGDIVIPHAGLHKGIKHEVIHVYGDGHYSIRPIGLSTVNYRVGSMKINGSDLSVYPTARAHSKHKEMAEANYGKKKQSSHTDNTDDKTVSAGMLNQ